MFTYNSGRKGTTWKKKKFFWGGNPKVRCNYQETDLKTAHDPLFKIEGQESGVHMSPHPKPPSIFLPHPIPLCCPRALTLSSLLHASNLNWSPIFSSVQFNHSVIYNSLRPHGLQHARVTCPSPTPGAYSNSCPSSL